jgi:nucleotide-binding universal stress UspA family protein
MTVCHITRPLEFNKILFATDLTDSAEKVFIDVLEIARELSASLIVTHVTVPSVELYAGPQTLTMAQKAREDYRKEMSERLDRLISIGRREGVDCEAVLAEGDPAAIVLHEAEGRSVDLIVVGVTSRGAIDRAVFGATAESIIRDARIPVLSLHIPTLRADAEEETQIVGLGDSIGV